MQINLRDMVVTSSVSMFLRLKFDYRLTFKVEFIQRISRLLLCSRQGMRETRQKDGVLACEQLTNTCLFSSSMSRKALQRAIL